MLKTTRRTFKTFAASFKKVTPERLSSKPKKSSSQHWLSRQLSDPYVEKAKLQNLRCRSAFKLMEIDDRFKILEPGYTVVDCGAAPGSWTQVVVTRINSRSENIGLPTGRVVAIDRQQIYPIEGAHILGNMDFTDPKSQEKIEELLNGEKAEAVISDMAPSATGIADLDNENIIKLCYSVLRFALKISKTEASVLVKLRQCHQSKQLETDMMKFYSNVKFVKPNSSRSDSSEIFLLGRDFKGLKSR